MNQNNVIVWLLVAILVVGIAGLDNRQLRDTVRRGSMRRLVASDLHTYIPCDRAVSVSIAPATAASSVARRTPSRIRRRAAGLC